MWNILCFNVEFCQCVPFPAALNLISTTAVVGVIWLMGLCLGECSSQMKNDKLEISFSILFFILLDFAWLFLDDVKTENHSKVFKIHFVHIRNLWRKKDEFFLWKKIIIILRSQRVCSK